ncbi:hypothetical protein [Prochlorococcus marinus]|uniref:hypothetical protein n=1 Tax=Prochlorococcus marinus TaxID=1219 RepID=UPI0022B406C3|nr:hypothetical protein [Prochlorococcus marinus]
MTEDWNTTDELNKDIITAVYKDINDQIEEMIEDIGCPRSFAEGLLISIADNFKDGTKVDQTVSSYSSRHTSTPEVEMGAQEIVSKHEEEARKTFSDLLKDFNKKVKVPGNDDIQSSLYSSRHISTQNDEKGAEAIVTKNEEKIREEMNKEKL